MSSDPASAGPGSAERPPTGPRPVRRPRLATDGARYLLATAGGVGLVAVYGGVVGVVARDEIDSLAFFVSACLGAWSGYALIYTGLTWLVLGRVDGPTLSGWLTENHAVRRRRRSAEWLIGSGGPVGAVSLCAFAIGAVVWATVAPALRSDPVIIGLAGLVVVSSWLLIATVYAVHYARESTRLGGLVFAGDEGTPRFSDYWYVSIQVGTAYNGADVAVTRRSMRRTLTVHAIVAFVFNSVLIALLVSLLTQIRA